MSGARALRTAIARRAGRGSRTEPITDPLAEAVARKLESRGITSVPGLSVDEPAWFDLAIESLRRNQEIRVEQEARQKAERAAQKPLLSAASILLAEIARAATGSESTVIPLNGAAVLRAALNGEAGTVNGRAMEPDS